MGGRGESGVGRPPFGEFVFGISKQICAAKARFAALPKTFYKIYTHTHTHFLHRSKGGWSAARPRALAGTARAFAPSRPRTDQIKLVSISVRGSWSISLLSFFRLRTVVVVGSLNWARSRLQPSIFRIFFPTYLESVPPQKNSTICVAKSHSGNLLILQILVFSVNNSKLKFWRIFINIGQFKTTVWKQSVTF